MSYFKYPPSAIRREDMFTLDDAVQPNSVSSSHTKSWSRESQALKPRDSEALKPRDSQASPQIIRPSFLSFIDTIFSPRPPRPSNRPPPPTRPSRPSPPPLPVGLPPQPNTSSRPFGPSSTSSRPFGPTPPSITSPRPLQQQQQRPLQGRPQQQLRPQQQGGRPQQGNRPHQQRPQNPEEALTLFNNGLDNIIQSPVIGITTNQCFNVHF